MTKIDPATKKYVVFSERILKSLNKPLKPNAKIFDLGSGSGQLVHSFRDKGYDCWGADLYRDSSPQNKSPYLGRIESLDPYLIPYDNDEFDFALSQNVFEHVQDYETTFSELSRVLKQGAFSLHMFPSRYSPIEEHVFIPGATVFQSYHYLYAWSWFSNLNPKWRGTDRAHLSWSEAARRNKEFLDIGLNYLTGQEILNHARNHFSSAVFIDKYLFESWPGKLSRLNFLVRVFPFLLTCHSAMRMRILLVQK